MQGINGFSPINLNTTVERTSQDNSSDVRFLQSILEVASGQKVSNPIVAAGPENSQLDFFSNPEKVISQTQKKDKNIDDILAEIEKILSRLKENK